MKYLIGLDIGTSNVKAVLFDIHGNELLVKDCPTEVIVTNGNWQEQDMMQVLDQCTACIKGVVDSKIADPADILALGLSGQGEGCWMIDKDGKPVKNASLWSDGRGSDIVDRIAADQPELFKKIHKLTGSTPLPPATLIHMLWYKEHMPEVYQEGNTVLNCKDWVRFCMTGNRNMELTDASISILDSKSATFSTEIFEELGMADLLPYLPTLIKPYDNAGGVTEAFAAATGLLAGTPVAGGALDVTATMVGVNAVNPGEIYCILGTTCCTGVVYDLNKIELGANPSRRHIYHPKAGLCIDLMPLMAGTPNLDWAIENISSTSDFAEIEKEMAAVPAGCGGVVYHPYITPSGERAPFYNPDARAGFFGMSIHTTRYHMVKAVYEGLAFAIRDCLDGVEEPGAIYVAGGGSKSAYWAQVIADCTGRQVVRSKGTEFGAKGAAILAGVCVGEYADINEAAAQLCQVDDSFDPNPDNVAIYNDLYSIYRDSRIANMELWHQREAIVKKYSNH